MSTEAILAALSDLEESPWADLKGRPLDSRRLANLLRPYGIRSKTVRTEAGTPKGYAKDDLHDAWQRYLPEPPHKSATSATTDTRGQVI